MTEHHPRFVPTHEGAEIIHLVEELVSKEKSKEPRLGSIIKGMRVEFGEDSDDRPAIWIYLLVDEKMKPSSEEVALLNNLANAITSGLIEKEVAGWPYVTFTELPAGPRGSSSRPA